MYELCSSLAFNNARYANETFKRYPITITCVKAEPLRLKTTYKYTKDKNPVSNQYTLFDS